jgi:hypothetical protein
MRLPRFQFRLWTIFACLALVGWASVAVPYWVFSADQRIEQTIEDDFGNEFLPRREMITAYDRAQMGYADPRRPIWRRGAVVLALGVSTAVTLALGLVYRRYRVPEDRAADNRRVAG